MKDKEKTKNQLIKELAELRQQVSNLEKLEIQYKRADLDNTGGLIGAIHTITDITERKRVEKELRTVHHQLMDIIEFLPDAIFVIDQDKKVVAWNRAIEEMTGVRKEDIIGKSDYAYAIPFHGRPRPILIDFIFSDYSETGLELRYDHIIKKEGETLYSEGFVTLEFQEKEVYLWSKASPLYDCDENVVGAIEFIRDVTDMRKLENELRLSRERFQALYEAIGCGVVVLGPDGRLTDANPYAEEILRFSRQEMIGRLIFQPDLAALLKKRGTFYPGAKAAQSGKTFHDSVVGLHNNRTGKRIWAQVNTAPLFDREGQIEGTVVTFMDITARKEIEAELARRKEFVERILQTARVVIVVTDLSGNIISLNRFGEQLSGYREEEVIGKFFTSLMPERDRKNIENTLKKILNGSVVSGHEHFILTKDGREVLVSWYSSLLHDEDRKANAVLAVWHDITELRAAEAQLIQAQKMEAVGRLAGGVAHDFNNLLTIIMGNISLALADAPTESSLTTVLKEAEIASKRAAGITTQLLGFSRKAVLQPHPININDCAAETVAILQRPIDPRISIDTRLKADLWLVKADPTQMTQVLMNFCLNAQDAMPDGGIITLETENATLSEYHVRLSPAQRRAGDFATVSINDIGCGMSPEVQEQMFEPFFTTKEFGYGSGLGLAVAYGIVRQQGGWIECWSEVGKGARFTIYLPRYLGETHGSANLEPDQDQVLHGNETILVVDDEDMVRTLAQRILSRYGYNVLTADEGLTALEIYRPEARNIDLVLLDLTMPKLSGMDTMYALKKINPSVTILLSSGYSLDGQGEDLLAAGAAGFMQKPYRAAELALAVRQVLDKKTEN